MPATRLLSATSHQPMTSMAMQAPSTQALLAQLTFACIRLGWLAQHFGKAGGGIWHTHLQHSSGCSWHCQQPRPNLQATGKTFTATGLANRHAAVELRQCDRPHSTVRSSPPITYFHTCGVFRGHVHLTLTCAAPPVTKSTSLVGVECTLSTVYSIEGSIKWDCAAALSPGELQNLLARWVVGALSVHLERRAGGYNDLIRPLLLATRCKQVMGFSQ